MKFVLRYTETAFGDLVIEADSFEQANAFLDAYNRGESVDAIDEGNKIERDYEITLTDITEVK